MELIFLGLSCLRLRGREVEVVVDPLPAGHRPRIRLAPDIVVRTDGTLDPDALRPHPDRPQEIAGPGEFEIRGVGVVGVPAGSVTVMRIEVDDVRIVAVGRLQRQLTEDEIDALGRIDVLTVPVGGGDALTATEATRLVNALEPPYVVPVRFAVPGLEDGYEGVERFAKEMGLENWTPQSKLTLTGAAGSGEETRVVILEPRGIEST